MVFSGIIFIVLLGVVQLSSKTILGFDKNKLTYKAFPLQLKSKSIHWKEVNEIKFKNDVSSLEFGGVGIRKIESGWAYILGHKNTMELNFLNNKKIVFDYPIEVEKELHLLFKQYVSDKFSKNTSK